MINGDRIRFRAHEKEDLPSFVNWLNDEETREGILAIFPMSMVKEEKWFEKSMLRDEREQPLLIEAKSGEDWKSIGTISLMDFDDLAHSAELGILIGNKEYWNKGYGTESVRLLMKFGFEQLNLNRISLQVLQDNPRAIRCYEKCGMTHEGKLREGYYANGKYQDVLFMSMLRDEWDSRQRLTS